MLLTNAYIWKDYEVDLGAAESVDFVVEINPQLIFVWPANTRDRHDHLFG